jgi:sporulation protein YlmC with PRC-barrel domain
MSIAIDAKVTCRSGPCGKVSRVIIDPIGRTLTHIVVEPHHQVMRLGRLVPTALIEHSLGEEIALACTLQDFDKLDEAEESEYLPTDGVAGQYYNGYASGYGGYGYGQSFFSPYWGLAGDYGWGSGYGQRVSSYEAVPAGEVTIRRGDAVHATDGDIGRVAGFVVDRRTHHVTHVLLEEGHLWGRKEVAIPVGAVTRVGAVADVNLTKHEVGELPAVDIDHPELVQNASALSATK